ncbi:hypothetical protein GBA52_019646 [Prunus armeniaca]|nr:hypothetical protein GBA52_019646 [Prunus armeniaca]
MALNLGFVVGILGVVILSHAAYSTVQYRGLLKIMEEEFSGPPLNDHFSTSQPRLYDLQPSCQSVSRGDGFEVETLRSFQSSELLDQIAADFVVALA